MYNIKASCLILVYCLVSLGCSNFTQNQGDNQAPYIQKNVLVNESVFAHFYQGLAYESEKKWGEACKHFHNAILIDPKVKLPLIHLALCLLKLGNKEEGFRYIEEACSSVSNEEPFFFLDAGDIYREFGAFGKATKLYEEAIKRDPSWDTPYIRLAGIYESSGDFAKAIKVFQEGVKHFSSPAKGYFYMGVISYRNQSFQDAILFFNKAYSLDPNMGNAMFYSSLAISYQMTGDTQKALETLNKVLQDPNLKDQDKVKMQLTMAYILEKNGKSEESLSIYNTLKTTYPFSPLIALSLSQFYKRQNDWDKAVESLTTFLLKGDSPEILRALGKLYNEQGLFSKSLPYLLRSLRIEPLSKEGMFLTAVAYYELKDYPNSEDFLKRLIQDPPYPIQAHLYLAEIYKRKKQNLNLARYHINLAMAHDPENESLYLDKLAEIDINEGMYQEAEDKWLRAFSKDKSPEYLEKLGNLYFALGLLEEAVICWTQSQGFHNNVYFALEVLDAMSSGKSVQGVSPVDRYFKEKIERTKRLIHK